MCSLRGPLCAGEAFSLRPRGQGGELDRCNKENMRQRMTLACQAVVTTQFDGEPVST